MRISRLSIANYKSARNVDVALPGPLVAVVGRNSSGKSSAVDAVLMASQSAQHGQMSPPAAISSRGEWPDLTFGKNTVQDPVIVELTIVDDASRLGFTFASPGPSSEPVICSYTTELTPGGLNRRVQVELGDSGSMAFDFGGPGSVSTQGNVQFDSTMFSQYMGNIRHLAAERHVEASITVAGAAILTPTCSNLIQVLNDLASSNRRIFDGIIQTAQTIVPEVEDILARLQPGSNITMGMIRESAFGDTEFNWPHLASGTRQAILLATFIHTAPKRALLLIEEPELYLHTESIWKLLDILQIQTETEEKRILLTTHSPVIVERLGLGSCLVASRDKGSGSVSIQSLDSFASLDEFLQKHGLRVHTLLMPSKGLRPLPAFLLLLEGTEDVGVWREFIAKAKLPVDTVKIEFVRNGGWAEAIKAASLLNLLARIGVYELPYLIVVESDDE